MPGAGFGRGCSTSSARANTKYGCAVRSIGRATPAASSGMMTAEARVASSCGRSFGLPKNVS